MTGSRVLVVEDDAPLAATLERVLVAEGHEVEVTGDGIDAVRRARARVPDLVVLDLMLPGADGVTVCRRMRETAQFPILMLTALSGTEHRVRGLDSGADDYLVKPFAYQELLALVLFGALVYTLLARSVTSNQDSQLRDRARQAAAATNIPELSPRPLVAPADLSSSTEIYIEILDTGGSPLYATAVLDGAPPPITKDLLGQADRNSGAYATEGDAGKGTQ